LTIWGKKDASAIPAGFSNARKFIRNLQVISLEDIGHWLLVEAKDQVTEQVSSWLSGLGLSPIVHGKL
jgi:soluble epoxide hydrolase / lipid-phosphate phosphatase